MLKRNKMLVRLGLTSMFIVSLMFMQTLLNAQMGYLDKMSTEVRTYRLEPVNARFVEDPPVLDGRLDDPCWQQSGVYDDFIITRNRYVAERQGTQTGLQNETRFYVLYDDRFIYLGIECMEEDMEGLRTVAFLHDDRNNIMGDDRVEVFIDLEHNHQKAINLVLNAAGATFDMMLERPIQYALSAIYKPEWNGKWHSNVSHYNDRWTAEIFVDINHIMRQKIKEGQTFGLMVGRGRSDRTGPLTRKHWSIGKTSWNNPKEDNDTTWKQKNTFDYEIWAKYCSFPFVSDWTHNGASGFYEPIMYADLICDCPKIEVQSIGFNEAFANYSGTVWQKPQFWGDNPLDIRLKNLSDQLRTLEIETKTKGFQGSALTDVRSIEIPAAQVQVVAGKIPVRGDGFQPFEVTITDKTTGEHLYNTTYVTRVPPFIEFDLEGIYMPEDKEKPIHFIPVIIREGFDDLTAELVLRSREDNAVIAREQIENFGNVHEFTPCFEALEINKLPSGNYYIDCELFDVENQLVGKFEQGFTRNAYEQPRTFGARKGPWKFGGITGEAVIVEYPDNKDFVLWKPANYFGMWFLNNVGLTYECAECWGYASGSCNEPMQDKKVKYQNAEIVENAPARVVVRWTYGLTNNNYDIFFNEWIEEYFILFPDGNGIRRIYLWSNTDLPHEIIQPQYIFPNGVLPGQMLENVITRVFNLEGEMKENLLGSSGGEMGYSKNWDEEILRMPLKNRKDPFMIIGKTEDLMPDLRLSNLLFQSAESRDIRYNLGAHWPINPLEVDVFNIVSTAMPYHSWIGLSQVQADDKIEPNIWTHFFGVTNRDDEYLKDVAASWLYPAEVIDIKGGYSFSGYSSVENAYCFEPVSDDFSGLEFKLIPADRGRIIHPFFILTGYKGGKNIRLLLNGKKLKPGEYRLGLVGEGSDKELQIWINKEITKESTLEIE